ncbi:MAG: hypothetical protein MUF58_16650 [Arcicella sp.]|jgi:hypothetical protein|nr:hypothetical protein [Arcicella sp.]
MKKTLTIILLIISFSGFSQTEKGDFVITPTVGWSTYRMSDVPEHSQKMFYFPVSIHKYLSDRLAIGLRTTFYHDKHEYYPVNDFYRKVIRTGIILKPNVRYNFLKTRFTPFIESEFLGILDYNYTSQFYDNPNINVSLREISGDSFLSYFSISYIDFNIGVSYFIKDRFGLQLSLATVYNQTDGIKAQFNLPYNFGLQFILNNPRSEIESPR